MNFNRNIFKLKITIQIMKNIYKLTIIPIFAIFLLSIAMVSATVQVYGTIYDARQQIYTTVSGANVSVVCGSDSINTTSRSDGTYLVYSRNCLINSNLTVSAQFGELSGSKNVIIHNASDYNFTDIGLDYAQGNVFMVPEFSLIIGTLTMVSAVVVFFLVRRK